MIPLHPEPYPYHPDRLRWIIPEGILAFAGQPVTVPAPLATLLADGTIDEITVEPAAVVTRLCAGRSWPREGARVRTALHAALAEPHKWMSPAGAGSPRHDGRCDRDDQSGGGQPRMDDTRSADELLYAAARDLLDGPVGEFARSHGGFIELVDVRDGVVVVRLGGACHGCPAARITLHQRLEHQLRQRYPTLREIKDVGASGRRIAHSRWQAIFSGSLPASR